MSNNSKAAERVVSYIDGFNLYFGLRDAGLECFKWLNIKDLSSGLLKEHQPLLETKYFTSKVSKPADKVDRQSAYLGALRTIPGLSIYYGKYEKDKSVRCGYCGEETMHTQEKMTDVNIAVSMLEDAYNDAFDTALLISGDSDLSMVLPSWRD